MRFGASTRRYVLGRRRPGSGGNTAGSSRKRSVSWPDEGDAAGVRLPLPSAQPLSAAVCELEGIIPMVF